MLGDVISLINILLKIRVITRKWAGVTPPLSRSEYHVSKWTWEFQWFFSSLNNGFFGAVLLTSESTPKSSVSGHFCHFISHFSQIRSSIFTPTPQKSKSAPSLRQHAACRKKKVKDQNWHWFTISKWESWVDRAMIGCSSREHLPWEFYVSVARDLSALPLISNETETWIFQLDIETDTFGLVLNEI